MSCAHTGRPPATLAAVPGKGTAAPRGRVLHLAVVDPDYPRNARLRGYLEAHGVEVVVVRAHVHGSALQRHLRQARDGWRAGRGFDAVVLSEFSLHFVWISWLLARRSRALHVVDVLVGMHETEVGDWQRVDRGGAKARVLRAWDRLALLASDVALTDTAPRAERFTAVTAGRRTVHALPVGAPAWDWRGDPAVPGDRLRVLYYGNYLPLHGVDVLVDGVAQARRRASVHLTLVGDGGLRPEVERRVRERLPDEAVTFVDRCPATALPGLIAASDVVAGVFGSSDKAAEVVANKVWQGLAAGRTVLTRESPALADLHALVGDRLQVVPAGSAAAVADRLVALSAPPLPHASGGPLADVLEQYVRDRYDEVFEASGLRRRLLGR